MLGNPAIAWAGIGRGEVQGPPGKGEPGTATQCRTTRRCRMPTLAARAAGGDRVLNLFNLVVGWNWYRTLPEVFAIPQRPRHPAIGCGHHWQDAGCGGPTDE